MRKSPVRHKVRKHTRKNRPVREHHRGHGKPKIPIRGRIIVKTEPTRTSKVSFTKEETIKRMYSHGWSPQYVKIEPVEGGIKIRGSLTRMNWGDIKFEMYSLGYSYDKQKRMFVKTHGVSELELNSFEKNPSHSVKTIKDLQDNIRKGKIPLSSVKMYKLYFKGGKYFKEGDVWQNIPARNREEAIKLQIEFFKNRGMEKPKLSKIELDKKATIVYRVFFETKDDKERLKRLSKKGIAYVDGKFVWKRSPNPKYDPKQLKIGIKVEMEHTKSPKVAERIAKDHLREFPDYYTRLVKMEKEAAAEQKRKQFIERTKGYRLRNDKLELYDATGKTTNMISTRNRRIVSILSAEGPTSTKELSRRLGLREKTIKIELEYLRKKGFVRKVD